MATLVHLEEEDLAMLDEAEDIICEGKLFLPKLLLLPPHAENRVMEHYLSKSNGSKCS